MTETSYLGMSLATSLQRQLDITSNNIANANTAGYKGEHVVFESYMQKNAGADQDPSQFVRDSGSYIDTRPGAVIQTGNPLDLALTGEGWFSYQTETGQRAFGRDGSFTLDTEGGLRTLAGAQVLDAGGGPIVLPTQGLGQLSIAEDGTISGTETGALARVGVFDIPGIQGYSRIGAGMFVAPPEAAAPQPSTTTQVMQGALEGSNINPIREMTRLIDVQRAYERTNTMMGNADNLRRDSLKRIGQAV